MTSKYAPRGNVCPWNQAGKPPASPLSTCLTVWHHMPEAEVRAPHPAPQHSCSSAHPSSPWDHSVYWSKQSSFLIFDFSSNVFFYVIFLFFFFFDILIVAEFSVRKGFLNSRKQSRLPAYVLLPLQSHLLGRAEITESHQMLWVNASTRVPCKSSADQWLQALRTSTCTY